ncbi:MAG: chromosome segregation protein SMC [Pirellulaceae bacterium]|nr:chromosome segregation protein SMC [Pirellulaceae bacterium]
MLKALELIGFKSFADKTRFEFPAGITVVVGPNGSGKSNIVDGIKWVLGEQSAKSLRGKDMADVIFKGTGTGGRKPANTAEATLVFDNTQGLLPVDAEEVHITRRVYRSGEGEYLINGKPCRLKDIRDMCRGTGVGVDAYSLIEQGKVDKLLQASPKDRRAIFEEAAGISRFKAKKIEAQRRLERVEQNLLRLSDIVEEVESRLRSVRAQASKAERYREYSERLQQLRTQMGYADWRRLSEKLEGIEAQRAELLGQIEELTGETNLLETQLHEAEQAADDAAEQLRQHEAELAANREQIAAREATAVNQRRRCEDFSDEAKRHADQLRSVTGRAGDLTLRLRQVHAEFQQADSEFQELRASLRSHEQSITELAEHIETARRSNQTRRAQYVERTRDAASLSNQVSSLESQLTSIQTALDRSADRLRELQQAAIDHVTRLEQSRSDEARLAEQANSQGAALEAIEIELAESRRILARRQQEVAVLQGKHSGASQRVKVLEELERQNAGLSSGVQQLLAEARELAAEEGSQIHGMVADLLEAGVEIAPLVDIALGDVAQHIVVTGDQLIHRIETGQFVPQGRVGLIRLDALPAAATRPSPMGMVPRTDLQGRPGVIGRADRVVRYQPAYRPLVQHLLGDTWFVDQLSDAIALSRTAGRGLRFVTTKRELLEADSTLIIGPPQTGTGFVSRRSELRAMQREMIDSQRRITEFAAETARLQENIDRQDQQRQRMVAAFKQLTATLADQRVKTRTLQDRHEQFEEQRNTQAAELDALGGEQRAAAANLDRIRHELAATEAAIAELNAELQQDEQQVQQQELELRQRTREATLAKVEFARSEQRLDSLRSQRAQCETDQQERSRAVAELQSQLDQALQRRQQAELEVLQVASELALLHLRKEELAGRAGQAMQRRRDLNARRTELASEQEKLRRRLRRLEEDQHRLELAAGEVHHERNTLAERLRDDYAIDISQVSREETPEEEQQRTEIEAEINDLRNKINRIGAVNLEALGEIEDLQPRYDALSRQYQDLTQAKESLERIIQKINADSRRLFMETLEAIRTNFQQLYRKAFGGGRADIVLEDNSDVLECGIDIVATPPGKPSFNNSLLSGGEKALTAVALLLAIFQFRPSPFCILDEVDAPFDEANIGRFVNVLHDFLNWTKFVVVTHSKKTMTAATTIYGVTMQESGVSKRVSVRFEDVSEDGQISEDALRRQPDDEKAA